MARASPMACSTRPRSRRTAARRSPSDNTRVPSRGAMGGWDMMRSRLVGTGDGHPMLVVFSTCIDFIRTVPFLQHDSDRPEEVMTDSEDVCGDVARYACMSMQWDRER